MGVYLINVHLMGVHLMGVHLMGVHLMGVHLMGAWRSLQRRAFIRFFGALPGPLRVRWVRRFTSN